MKWMNKGREWESYREVFQEKGIFIYGAGGIGLYVENFLRPLTAINGFIDRNKELNKIRDVPVYSLKEFRRLPLERNIIILAAQDSTMKFFAFQLLSMGYKEGIDFFFYQNFIDFYVHLYALYACNKVYAPFISFRVSPLCNLRCIGCATFQDRRKTVETYSMQEIKKNIDAMFLQLDVINYLDICGGEPTIIPLFTKVINYIGENYRSKVIMMHTVINATVIPSDEFCETMKKYDVVVDVDDYRETVDKCNDTFFKVCDKLEAYQIRYQKRKVPYWIDILADHVTMETEEDVQNFYNECRCIRRTVHKGKIGLCDYAYYAYDAGAFSDINEGELLSLWEEYDKSVLTEFLMGYSDYGYCNMCKYCNGNTTINQRRITVAQQKP